MKRQIETIIFFTSKRGAKINWNCIESDFSKRNPGLALDVLYHELAHGHVIELDTELRNLPELLRNSGYDDDSTEQDKYFHEQVGVIRNFALTRPDGPGVDKYKSLFAPCGYSFTNPINW